MQNWISQINVRFLAGALALGIGSSTGAIQPVFIQGLRDNFHMPSHLAGLIATSELLSVAVAAVAFGLMFNNRQTAQTVGLTVIVNVLAGTVTSLSNELLIVIAARIVAGLTYGVLLGIGASVLAGLPNPGRNFALATILSGLLNAIGLITTGLAVHAFEGGVFYSVYGSMSLLVLAGSFALSGVRNQEPSATPTRFRLEKARPILFAILMWFVSQGVFWSFSDVILARSGLDIDTTNTVLGIALLFGLAGAGFSGLITRYRSSWQIPFGLFALLVMALAGFSSTLQLGQVASATGLFIYNVCYFIALPSLMRLTSEADHTGAVASVASGISLLGMAVGPLIGGIVVEFFGVTSLGVTLLVLSAFAFVFATRFRSTLARNQLAQ